MPPFCTCDSLFSLMNPASQQVARYIQSVSDAGDNPKLQETLEALKPYACLGERKQLLLFSEL